ncbi:MAG: excinuclease ABC subunit UvrA [Bacteroidales bacterium]|nr:excinuclease ABC subunit UvrA [Bacteroidales bacterium]
MTKKLNNKYITIKGAKVNNLKNIDLKIERNKLIVITGLSGSGKSSLAFDTLYAEGQRRYVESLSSYARQFLGRINKPEVDFIKGIPPAIAIEQKVNTRNPRSTVGTSTEIYDFLKLLYSRIGKTISPVSGQIVKKNSITDIVNYILKFPENSKVQILAPLIIPKGRTLIKQLEILVKQGFSRIEINGEIIRIEDYEDKNKKDKINLVIDRTVVNKDEDNLSRIADSIETAYFEAGGKCIIQIYNDREIISKEFSNLFEADGLEFEEPSDNMFSFNSPLGACPKCEGFGKVLGIDEDLVIPNKNLSIYEDAIVCWKGEIMKLWKEELIFSADKFDFPIHRPYYELSEEEKLLLWIGNKHFKGLNKFFDMLEKENYKIQYRVMLSRYRGKTICPECYGTRLKKQASYVEINKKKITELVLMPIDKLLDFIINLKLDNYDREVSKRLIHEIKSRLEFLINVGLSYLTLNRLSSTLSGGESQRINLATSLGSSLVGSLYILDEPSIGLHSRDTNLLIQVLKNLQKIGNTVIVVEHDEEIMRSADEIIDIGPLAGSKGGELVYQGSPTNLLKEDNSLTMQYLTGKRKIEIPNKRKRWTKYIEIIGARENNLKGVDVKFPLNILTVVTGVSGSGKSSLVNNILYNVLNKRLKGFGEGAVKYKRITGNVEIIKDIEFVDQNPIGKSSRSNPVTYLKAYDEIRKLYSEQAASKINDFKPSHFSFNVDGGRCDECQGEGEIKVEMQFMADVVLKCESCNGMRFKNEVLEVKYRNKNIYDILELTVNEAIDFFNQGKGTYEKKIVQKLQPLVDVGLGYIKLGQSSSTLSGGESQRVKLASFLSKENNGQTTLFIFDEPTTGLHFHDVNKLLLSFNALIEKGHTVIIIEHNLEVIKSADWIIDIGPEGGEYGGNIVFEGTPEDIIKNENSYTGKYLKSKF